MSNYIYKSILVEQAEFFFNSFIRHCRTRATDPTTGKLTHSGMFGAIREKIARNFLGLLSPSGITLSNNMKIITPFEGESSECDIVLYDNYNATIITANDHKYVPVECVSSIIEVKSVLDKTSFVEALRKLANNKLLRSDLAKYRFLNKNTKGAIKSYYSDKNPIDQIFTVLICEKIDTDISKLDFEATYHDIPLAMRHNLIYSLNDGVFIYTSPEDKVRNPWPCLPNGTQCTATFVPLNPGEEDNALFHFCQFFNLGLRCTSTFDLEIIRYLIKS